MGSINEIVFTSDQLAKQHIQYAKKIHSEPGMRWGIQAIDERIIPARGGDVNIILGRPGDGKTSVLCYLASHHARNIVEEGKNLEETVVYVTWEGTVDKIYAALLSARGRYSSTDFYWGRVSVEQAEATAVISGVMPITFIGFSSFRKTGYKAITLDSVLEAVDAIQEGDGTPKRKVRCLYLDYAQLITVPGSSNRTESTSEAIIGVKNLGIRLDIPSFVGGQAGRQVDSYQIKLAGPADAQHSCLPGDSKIACADSGRLYNASDVHKIVNICGSFTAHCLAPDLTIGKREITKSVKNGQGDVFVLDCGTFGSVRATENHRFYTGEGWKKLSEIRVGDMISRPLSMPIGNIANSISYEAGFVLGTVMGDGCLTRSVLLTNKDLDIHAKFKECVEKEWPGYTAVIVERETRPGVYDSTIMRVDGRVFPGCNSVLNWIKSIGLFGKKSETKFVPDIPMDDNAVRGILSGLFSTDGSVYKNYKYPIIGYYTTSKALAEQVRYLLLRLGISSSISLTEQGRYNPIYKVIVRSKCNYVFANLVHICGEKGDKMLRILRSRKVKHTTAKNCDRLPPEWNMKSINVLKEHSLRGEFNNVKGRSITRSRMRKIALATRNAELEMFSNCELEWCKVVSIKHSSIEETYDFCVPGDENFIADGFVVHNSQLEQHVDGGYSVWRPARTEPYDPHTPIDLNIYGRSVPLRPTLLLLKNWKQRGDDVGGWWPLYLRPEFLHLAEMELEVEER